jgi:hypothetical protein
LLNSISEARFDARFLFSALHVTGLLATSTFLKLVTLRVYQKHEGITHFLE